MAEYIPLGTKVLLKKLPKQEVKQGSIITIEEPKDKLMAEIVAFGVNCSNNIIPDHSEGKIVRYAPYTAHVIDEENPDFLIVDEKDIWCFVE